MSILVTMSFFLESLLLVFLLGVAIGVIVGAFIKATGED